MVEVMMKTMDVIVAPVLFRLVYLFTEAYIYWGEENAPVDQKTVNNCFQFLYSQMYDSPIPTFTLNENRTISIDWEMENSEAHLEVGITKYSFYAKLNNDETVLKDGDATNIPTDLITSILTITEQI